ncbi:head maturation protease, ClpP-related [Nonomuraea angiospora]|uniref:head maturation protease, ClpP-related n=1 Tax=Nonomuraea angiospora TaxID=46172 RepID=UPI0033DD6790
MTRPNPIDGALVGQVRELLARREDRSLPQGYVRPAPTVTMQADGDAAGAELLLYDEIGFWGIWAVDVAAALSTVSGPLHVKINSPGGDVFDGIAIFNMLADYPDQVTVTVDSLAASAASFIAMAGDTIRMNRASQMMIHDASGGCRGHAADMRAMAGLLDQLSATIAGIYAARAGGTPEEWRERMLVDGGFGTWYTAEEAVEAGLADELVPLPIAEPEPVDSGQAAARAAAALFPYGADDAGRWRLAALAAPDDQASAPEPPRFTDAASPQAPAEPTPEPTPAPPTAAVEPEPAVEPDPDPWAVSIAHLLEPPTPEGVLASLRRAVL